MANKYVPDSVLCVQFTPPFSEKYKLSPTFPYKKISPFSKPPVNRTSPETLLSKFPNENV